MYINQPHNRWPSTLPRIAVRLRQVVDLPGLTVRTRRDQLAISWVGGPAADPVFAELEDRLGGVVAFRAVRLYPVAMFGAALLEGCHPVLDDCHFRATWRMLHDRNLVESPLAKKLVKQGAVLAAIAGAPSTAVLGWGRRRWDWEMWKTLQRLGPDVVEAVCVPAAS